MNIAATLDLSGEGDIVDVYVKFVSVRFEDGTQRIDDSLDDIVHFREMITVPVNCVWVCIIVNGRIATASPRLILDCTVLIGGPVVVAVFGAASDFQPEPVDTHIMDGQIKKHIFKIRKSRIVRLKRISNHFPAADCLVRFSRIYSNGPCRSEFGQNAVTISVVSSAACKRALECVLCRPAGAIACSGQIKAAVGPETA